MKKHLVIILALLFALSSCDTDLRPMGMLCLDVDNPAEAFTKIKEKISKM